jgi:hypothetical protein
VATFYEIAIDHIINGVDRANHDRRARAVVDLATITLLVDAGLTTFEKAAQRIVEIQAGLPEQYQAPDVSRQLQATTQWLLAQQRPRTLAGALGTPDPAPADDEPKF